MIVAFSLLGYAALLLTVGAGALARARWPARAPRLAIAAWFALTGSAVVSVLAGGVALTAPTVRVSVNLAELLASCVTAFRSQYAHLDGAAMSGAGAVIVLAVLFRVTCCTVSALAQTRRERREHRLRLSLIGRHDPGLGAVIVCHENPVAYCLPGRESAIVLTTGAIEILDAAQLSAVLAHERAHLRGRHHLLVALAGVLAASFPRVPALLIAAVQVARLAEFCADDAASRAAHRLSVADALLNMSAGVPAGALGASGTADAVRVRRLIAGPAALGRFRAAAVVSTAAAVILLPLVLLAGQAASASSTSYCPHARGSATLATAAAASSPGKARAFPSGG